jgi:AbrB family looped-hinge helix DNA binding protein
MPISTMTSKGQITIPKPVRDQLHLRPGDKIDFRILQNGTVTLTPRTTRTDDVFGMLAPYAKGKPATVEEMDEAIAESFRRGKP